MRIRFLPAVLAAFLAACAAPARRPTPPPPTAKVPAAPVVRTVPEAWVSAEMPAEELDSVATWTAPDGAVRAIVTAKSTHRLVVFDGDTGERLRTVGEQ